MNILLIGLGDSGLDSSDSEPVRRLQEYARRAAGHIDLIVDSPAGGCSDFGALTVHRTGTGRVQFLHAAGRLARRAARKNPPDVISSQDPFLTALAGFSLRRTLRRPLLIQNHSCFLFNRYWIAERPVLFRALHTLARFLLPRADAWRVVNTTERKLYIDKLGLPADRIRVLPVPCNLADFSKDRPDGGAGKIRARWGLPSGAPVCIWAGRPVRFKRLPLLFRAFAGIRKEYPEARLIVAGRKELAQENLDRAVRENCLGDAVVWSGGLPHPDLAELFSAADVFLYPSIYEGFGRVLVEAGAAGLPAVATATAGAKDIVDDGCTGFLVPIEDASALARRACGLLSNPKQRRTVGAAARKAVPERFDSNKLFDGIVSQWRETAHSGRQP
jgi:glycosyltransferase involved in cell wall biosynthesis